MQKETAEHGTSNTEVDETESVWTNAYRALSNPFDFSQFSFIFSKFQIDFFLIPI